LIPKVQDVSTDNVWEYFGPVMAACRKRAGLSQEKLGELLYLTASAISKAETNSSKPKMDFILAWADATNSKDALSAFVYGVDGVRTLINKLKAEGYWPKEKIEE
jgi:transcriptional regulator with XRE-family HTH domain